MGKLDSIYFKEGSWTDRRKEWVESLSGNSDFERAQVEIIVQTLAKKELAPRCVVNIGGDALLKFFKDRTYKNTYDLEADQEKLASDSKAQLRPFPLMGSKKHVVSERRRYADELIHFEGGKAKSLYFGAVALSGSGIRFYGEYCMLISENEVANRNPRVLDRNSYDLLHPPSSTVSGQKRPRRQG
jgi:hypothetical protein